MFDDNNILISLKWFLKIFELRKQILKQFNQLQSSQSKIQNIVKSLSIATWDFCIT